MLRAGRGSAAALEELCGVYWFPVYAWFRRAGLPPEDAREQTQELFAGMLRRRDLARVTQEGGRFRAWMATVVRNQARNLQASRATQKRDHLEDDDAERRLAREISAELDPEAAFERSWALAMLDGARARLRARYEELDQAEVYDTLSPALVDEARPYAELALALGIAEGAVKVAVHRLRQRFGEALRAEVLDTVDDPSSVDAELRALLDALAAR